MLCRSCDRGNIYCSAECSQLQRRASLARAGRKYQQTSAGRVAHAQRQLKYRERHAESRQKKKVTHHTSQSRSKSVSVENNSQSV